MKSRNLIFLSFIVLAASGAFISFQQKKGKKPTSQTSTVTLSGSYQQQWSRVDSLTQKGLSKSALEQVMNIYKKAKAENNAPQLVKAVIHRMKLQSYTEEDAMKKMIGDLKKEASSARFPARPLLHSMLAETYVRFYAQNRYRFLNRTETADYKNDDINTWDLKKIVKETIHEYELSMVDEDSSKHAQVNIYDDVIQKGNADDARKFRPSLYDFVAHRALDFFVNEESGLTEPANKFEINNAFYMSNADIFLNVVLKADDSLSLKFRATKFFQNLIAFHRRDAHPGALIDVNLERLKFVHDNITLPNKDSLYFDALQEMEKQYADYPGSVDVLFEIASMYFEWGNRYAFGEKPEAKMLIKKAKEVCEAGISRFPYSQGGLNCKSLKSRIEEKSMAFTIEQINIPDQPFRAKLDYKNIRRIYFRIAKNDRDETNEYEDLYGEKLTKHYVKLPVIKQWNVDVEDDGDFQQHSTEIKIPELPVGNYVILSGSDPDFSYEKNAVAYTTCWVSNISYVTRRRQDGGFDFYLLHRETGEPLADVTAQLYAQEYDYIFRKYKYVKLDAFKTNADGFFSVASVSDYRNFDIEFTRGKDRLFLNDNFYQYRNNSDVRKTRTQTFFFTDRSIYRPGQTVYFKGIVLETDGEKNSIKTKQATTVTMFDVNGQKVSDQTLTTNEYGTFGGSFTAPMGLLNGTMRIGNESGSIYFSVEEYKRPKFEVTFEPIKGVYRLNDKVSVKGRATAYSGANIDNAEVKYSVVRTATFPFWNYYWRGYPPSPQMVITHGTTATNDQGEFSITFDAIPDNGIDKETNPIFNFKISADVTDLNGETQSGSQNVSVSYNALMLSVAIPSELNRESATDFMINTKNLSGEFVSTKGMIAIAKLKEPSRIFRKRKWQRPEKQTLSKEEYERTFPYDLYADEDDPDKWENENTVYGSGFNTEKDSLLHLASIKDWKQGIYKLEATTKDKYGSDVKFVKYFTLFSEKEKQAPLKRTDWFYVIKDNAEPGNSDQFLIGTRDQDVKVLYEVEQKGEVISKQWLLLNDEQKRIDVPILESYRGNIAVHFTFVKHNRDYHFDHVLTVPYTNKALDISFETFRSKLYPGQKEEWKIKIRGKAGEKVAAEMLATMYDASLDAFKPHNWMFSIYNSYYSTLNLEAYRSFGIANSNIFSHEWNNYAPEKFRTYDQLNWFGFSGDNYYYRNSRTEREDVVLDMAAPMMSPKRAETTIVAGNTKGAFAEGKQSFKKDGGADKDENNLESTGETGKEKQNLSGIKGRANFNETAFFYPQLSTNDSGEVIVSFTLPEALTRWKMMGFAHTADLKYGMIEKELVTQKELMVIPDPPRFFREGDKISFTTKISNLSDSLLSGTTQLFLYDAITMQPLNIFIPSSKNIKGEATSVLSFTASKGQSATAEWNLSIPEGVGAITYKVVAKAGNYSDGEEQTIPVLTNRMLVTETMPLPVRGNQSKAFEFIKLKNSGASTTLRNHKLTLEFTSNPAWYAVQALPYMMEFPYECSEQVFSRYYANAIASHIANSNPKVKAVFDNWKSSSPDAFLSNLEKNQELKSLMLEETPWVLDAKNESERKKRVALLFDLNKMSNELNGALLKLQKKQVANGAWPWFDGMPDDRYITQYIVEGFGHLDHLGVKNVRGNDKVWEMVKRAVQYLDARIKDDYNHLVEIKVDLSKNQLSAIQIQYLYARSYFKDIAVSSESKKAFDFYKDQSKKFWLNNGEYLEGMIALELNRFDDGNTISTDILKSLKENSQYSEELGMYWKNNTGGYYWMQAPIETQALMIEAFDEITNDQKAVDDMKVWLLKQKQTQDWKTTKATAEACYSLLLRGTNWLTEQAPVEITIGNKKINATEMPDLKVEAGTGYFKTSWSGGDIKPEMANVKVENKNNVVAWGALYWQYFEQLDKITPHPTPINLKKELFLEKNSSTGPIITPITTQTNLKPGDRIKVRIELRVDRDMEYVMMKDMRAAGCEPENVLSQFKWQDELGYYESTRDASTNFFFSYLPKGTYVFEYPLRVSHKGDFSNGITEIQCMYAPEFAAHSEGIRLSVKQ